MKIYLKFVLNIFLVLVEIFQIGFLFTFSWNYFVASKFKLSELSVMEGIGVSLVFNILVLGYFASIMQNAKKNEKAEQAIDNTRSPLLKRILLVYPSYFLLILAFHELMRYI